MILIYGSIALVVAALIYLAYAAFQAFKNMKPDLKRVEEATGRIQQKADAMSDEMNKLTKKQQQIQMNLEEKKETIAEVVEAAKQTPSLLKGVWDQGKTVPPFRRVKRKPASELGKFGERVLTLLEKKYKLPSSK
jgi:uncharacterized protein YoxC